MTISRREVLKVAATGLIGAAAAARRAPALAQARPLKIGALISQVDAQGQDELIQPYDQQMRLGLELAVTEINSGGGILGRPVELVIADDDGSPVPGAAAALELIRARGAEALVSGFIMAMPPFLDRMLEREGLNIPIIHAFQTPGTFCGRVAHAGSTTVQAISTLLDHLGADARQRTFQISDWSPSQRTVSQQFYNLVQGGSTGAALVTTPVSGNSPGEYTGLVRWAQDLDARNFWISIPRPYAVNVVTQADAIGAASSFDYHFLEFSEWQASQLPAGVTAWASVPFVASDDSPGVRDFVARARRHAGDVLVTHVAFTHYNAVRALKLGMEQTDSTDGDRVLAALDGASLETATGPMTWTNGRHATLAMYVARATRGSFEVAQKFDRVEPGSTCP